MNLTIIPVGMLGTNCYILASEAKGCFIIDPGAQPDKIASVIGERGLTPRYILLTHGHHDHIGGVKKLMERYPDVALYIGAGDAETLTDPAKSHGVNRGGMTKEEATFENVHTAREGDTFAVDELTVSVLETPGHSLGGLTYLCENLMFSGDTLFWGDVGRTDLYGGDYDTLKASLRKLSALDGDFVVYPGHGESTTLNYERQHNRYIRE